MPAAGPRSSVVKRFPHLEQLAGSEKVRPEGAGGGHRGGIFIWKSLVCTPVPELCRFGGPFGDRGSLALALGLAGAGHASLPALQTAAEVATRQAASPYHVHCAHAARACFCGHVWFLSQLALCPTSARRVRVPLRGSRHIPHTCTPSRARASTAPSCRRAPA